MRICNFVTHTLHTYVYYTYKNGSDMPKTIPSGYTTHTRIHLYFNIIQALKYNTPHHTHHHHLVPIHLFGSMCENISHSSPPIPTDAPVHPATHQPTHKPQCSSNDFSFICLILSRKHTQTHTLCTPSPLFFYLHIFLFVDEKKK